MTLDRYLSNLPLLHTWDNGKTWNTGGFRRPTFDVIHPHIPDDAEILETGAGNSTIFFLLHKPKRLVSIAPDHGLFDRIHTWCDQNGVDRAPLEVIVKCSEWTLPGMATEGQRFDLILIDGNHGWPIVFVDFCYATAMLRQGGLLMIDDTQLHSIKELGRLLIRQPEFKLVTHFEKTALFRKISDVTSFNDWFAQPYIVERSADYQRGASPFAI